MYILYLRLSYFQRQTSWSIGSFTKQQIRLDRISQYLGNKQFLDIVLRNNLSYRYQTYFIAIQVLTLVESMELLKFLLFICLMTSACALETQSHLKISNNGYQLLVVAVHDSVPDNPALFEKIKVRTMDDQMYHRYISCRR